MENAQKYDIVSHITITKIYFITFFPQLWFFLIIHWSSYNAIIYFRLLFFFQQSYSSRPMFVAFVFVHILHLLYDVQPFL